MPDTIRQILLLVSGSYPAAILAKSTLIVAFGLIASRLAFKASAAGRHAFLAATFGAVLILPGAAVVLSPVHIVADHRSPALAATLGEGGGISITVAHPVEGAAPAARGWTPTLYGLLCALWIGGALLSLIPVVISLVGINRLMRSGTPSEELQAVADRISSRSKRIRRTLVLLHESLPGPIALGVINPTVALPPDAREWQSDDLHRALVHEMEHLRRRDSVIHCWARVTCSLYWFNPLVWIARRQLVLEAERACDDVVLATSEATAYASQLLAFARRLTKDSNSPAPAMAGRADLGRRIGAVLDARRRRGRAGSALTALALLLMTVAVAGISPIQFISAEVPIAGRGDPKDLPEVTQVVIFPIRPDAMGRSYHMNGHVLSLENYTLVSMMGLTYGVSPQQVVGGPDWVDTAKFDVSILTVGEPTQEQWIQILEKFAADYFHLSFHRQRAEIPTYLLTVRGSKPRLTRSNGTNARPSLFFRTVPGGVLLPASNTTMADFANAMSRGALDRPVIDQTGLNDRYNFMLYWARDNSQFAGSFRMPPSPNSNFPPPDLFTAMRKQLGLQLKPETSSMQMLAIDHSEQPPETQWLRNPH